MIKKLILVTADSLNAHINQAIEAALMDYATDGTFVLYLWQNDGAVFIGKNQNAYLECNLEQLKKDGGLLARRISGGGAVYHDKGNLNFTFIAPKADYHQDNQFSIVLSAMQSLGFDAKKSGRNDILINDKKFSGNAFYFNDKIGLHHGTVLIKSDYNLISKYLSASKIKLKSNSVASVASRVINLSEIKPDITTKEVSDSIIAATEKHFGLKAERLLVQDINKDLFNKWYKFCTDEQRINGDNVFYDARVEHRFSWGTSDIRLKLDKNVIIKAKIYSDGLDTDLIEQKEKALIGQDIYNITNEEAKDIIEVIREEIN